MCCTVIQNSATGLCMTLTAIMLHMLCFGAELLRTSLLDCGVVQCDVLCTCRQVVTLTKPLMHAAVCLYAVLHVELQSLYTGRSCAGKAS